MKDVVRKLYDSGIITDEFLSSISSKNKTSVRAKITQLVEFLSENIYHIDYYISKRNNDNEDLNHRKLALVNKKMLPDWYPPTRIVD